MRVMSVGNGQIPCLGELSAASAARRLSRQPPACDYAEKHLWDALGGGWQCLHGCYCQGGVSVEWHEFTCVRPRDWARSFHPDGVELCLNVSGQARVSCGQACVIFGPLSVGLYHAEPGRLAAWRLPGEPHRFLTVEFSRSFLESRLRDRVAALHPVLRRVLLRQSDAAGVASLGRLALSGRKRLEALRQPPVAETARPLWYQGQALALLAEFCFDADPAGMAEPSRRRTVARERVERTIQVLSRQLAEPPSLEALGREVGCSPYHLSRTFSRELGMTIPQYLRQIRMERAAELLKSGRFNVTEAALEVGYASLSHFSQAFCETMGCCPGLYPVGLRAAHPARGATAPSASRRQ